MRMRTWGSDMAYESTPRAGEPKGPVTGPQGPIGPTGPQGEPGPQGTAGNNGSTGPVGATGEQGLQGSQGPIGPTGTTGQTGLTGSQGNPGIQGEQGIQGVAGTPAQTPIQASATRTLGAAFQISATRGAFAAYSVKITVTSSIGSGQDGDVILEIASDSGFTADVQTLAIFGNSQSITLALVLNSIQPITGVLSGYVPAGYYARLRTVSNSGAPAFAYRAGQETLL